MLAGNPALFFDRLVRDFGDFVHYRGLFSFYLVNHPALVKEVLQETNRHCDKQTVIYDRFRNPFGNGLVVAEGDRWRRQRRRMQPLFGHEAIREYFPRMVESAEGMARRWEAASRTGQAFDVASEMTFLTLEIVGRAIFHDAFDSMAAKIGEWTHVINRYSAKPPLPIIRSPWFPSRINRRLAATLTEFHGYLLRMIDARRGTDGTGDLISRLLAARDEESGAPMSDQEIAEEALGMIIGGHETSSSALAWLWQELDGHPDIRGRIDLELDAVVGSGPVRFEHLPKLVYTRMVIEETLRLHPPFWFENRNVSADGVELGGEAIPRDSLVVFSRYSLHRHPDFWKEPDRFDPERFRPGHEENSRGSHAYVPFGGGPRICIGHHFAMMELVTVVAVLAGRYHVRLHASHRHGMAAHLTMAPAHGVRVVVERRGAP
jgi:cytochrome P450